MTSRFWLHPVLLNRQSRHLFIIYFLILASLGALLWWQYDAALQHAGIDLALFSRSAPWAWGMIVSPYFRVGFLLMGALLASGWVGKYIVGPVKRIEQYLEYWEAGSELKPLRVREDEKFSALVHLVNGMYEKVHRSPPQHAEGK